MTKALNEFIFKKDKLYKIPKLLPSAENNYAVYRDTFDLSLEKLGILTATWNFKTCQTSVYHLSPQMKRFLFFQMCHPTSYYHARTPLNEVNIASNNSANP
jgi:hypothetical protein